MFWFWAFVLFILFLNSIRSYFKISSLKDKIKFKDNKIKSLESDLHNEMMINESLKDYAENGQKIKSKKRGKATGVHYDDYSVFRARKIDGKYYQPIKDMEDNGHLLYKKKVVITGEFEDYPDRNVLAELIWSLGADIDTTVNERTDYLIIGEDHGPRKYENAQEFGVKIIDEVDLRKILE